MKQPHRARRLALQSTCCIDVQGRDGLELVESFLVDSRETRETIDAARRMVLAILDDREQIDQVLVRNAHRWSLSRLALVDRNILRLGVYELLARTAPPRVAITEALRLAQEFSTEESPRFINGVLDAVMGELYSHAGDGDQEVSKDT